jgi:hypothetical protein
MPSWTTRITGLILAILICCTPEMLMAATQSIAADSPAPAQNQSTAVSPDGNSNPAPSQNTQTAAPSQDDAQQLPDAPSANANSAAQDRSAQSNSSANQQPAEPAGTAAAQIGKLKGGPASKPAGAAIAPAKQRRVRSLLLKFGALAGAGAALGMVYALSRSGPSRPPGAR